MSKLQIVAVKLTRDQLSNLDAEVARRRRTEVAISRSSVIREAIENFVKGR